MPAVMTIKLEREMNYTFLLTLNFLSPYVQLHVQCNCKHLLSECPRHSLSMPVLPSYWNDLVYCIENPVQIFLIIMPFQETCIWQLPINIALCFEAQYAFFVFCSTLPKTLTFWFLANTTDGVVSIIELS